MTVPCGDSYDAADDGEVTIDVDEVELLYKLACLRAVDTGFVTPDTDRG